METIHRFRRWKKQKAPSKVLAIRFQALGDTIITLPYLQELKIKYPGLSIDFLTRKEVSLIPSSLKIFDSVIAVGGGRNVKLQVLLLLCKLPFLFARRYHVIIDLQNNRVSKLLRKFLFPAAWTEFDKSSPQSAGIRTMNTINRLGVWKINLRPLGHQNLLACHQIGESFGLSMGQPIVVLNPAGYSPSRSWPTEHYISFATKWLSVFPETKFVLLLLPAHRDKARVIANALGDACLDLTGQANQWEAFNVVRNAQLVLTEDSGLMHMAWVQGTPTVALFSSSRKDWSAPQGDWSYCFDSSDMPCGPCNLEVCKFGDNRCLTRITPEMVFIRCRELLHAKSADLIQT